MSGFPWDDHSVQAVYMNGEKVWERYGEPMWQPIDTAPKDGTRVLVWEPGLVRPIIAYFHIHAFPSPRFHDAWTFGSGELCRGPTHWMPLPDPPNVP